MNVQIGCCALKFKISVDWPDADVDAVYSEIGGPYQQHTVTNDSTPTTPSVERFLEAVFRDSELNARGIDTNEFDSLMMGCCAVQFEVSPDRVNDLPQLIEFATQRMQALQREHVRYYPQGKGLRGCCVQIVTY